jgi:hypothetical protein
VDDLLDRLTAAIRTAMQSYPGPVDRERWVRETLLVALGSRGLAVVDIHELAALRAAAPALASKPPDLPDQAKVLDSNAQMRAPTSQARARSRKPGQVADRG